MTQGTMGARVSRSGSRQPRADPAATARLYPSLGRAADGIGTAAFYRRLMDAIGLMLDADLSMVMRYSRYSAPEYVVHDELQAAHMEYYLRGLYRVDPVYRLCREPGVQGVYNLDDVCTPEERNGEYFSIFLQMTGMADDLVVLFAAPAGSTIGLVYERKTAFRRSEVEDLRRIFPLLAGMHGAHERLMLSTLADQRRERGKPFSIVDHDGRRVFESQSWREALRGKVRATEKLAAQAIAAGRSIDIGAGLIVHVEPLDAGFALAPNGCLLILEDGSDGLPPISYEQALERFLEGKLTPREREIVSLVLLGFPTSKLAERLGLSVNTVKNHKKRLYLKLDITTERELFLTFVSFLFQEK
jgi:DNA-binding CsgD family transcriptional regulator